MSWELEPLGGCWERGLPLLVLRELWEGQDRGGRKKCAGFDPSCANPCVFSLTTVALWFKWFSGFAETFVDFSARSGSEICLCACLEAERWVCGAWRAGEGLLKPAVCWVSPAVFSLSLCASAVIEDKWLEAFAEDINVSVRRGIRLRLLFVRRLLWWDRLTFLFGGLFLRSLFGCFEVVVVLFMCFCCCLTFRLLPLSPFLFFPPTPTWPSLFSFWPHSCASSSCSAAAAGSCPFSSSFPFEGDEGLLVAEATWLLLCFPLLPVFDCSGMIPPRRPFAAALASTSWAVSTLVGSAC